MRLSVIIACLNGAAAVTVQIEALTKQHWSEPWEIIFADNGSTDNTLEIVRQYQGKLPNLRILDASGRPGKPYACNLAAQVAAGEALAFCDADDEIAPGWVAAMGEALAKHDFVAGRVEASKLNKPWVVKSRKCPQKSKLVQFICVPHLDYAFGCNIGIKRSLHEAIGGFDESLTIACEDMDYCWRAQLAGAKLHFISSAIVHYRLRDTLMGIYRQGQSYAEAHVLLYKKHKPSGLYALPLKEAMPNQKFLLRWLTRIRDKGSLASWIWHYAHYVGYQQSCAKYQIFD